MQKSRLKEKYEKEVKLLLQKEFDIKNTSAIPEVEKVVLNMGIGEISRDKELKETLSRDLATVSGQVPSLRLAKVSVAAFGIRLGMPVGLSVTLRGERMYAFLDKFFSIVLPRLRDFRGVSVRSFDKEGNYTLGLNEHTVFPEIDAAKSAKPKGIEVTIVTNSGSPEKSKRLLELLGMPFAKENLAQGKPFEKS